MSILRLLSRTKLYSGLAIICLIGALASPHSSSGRNIFLSFNNLTDVLRQVSITGLVATGMTLVILLGGIDLSVGSMMGFSTIISAMLLISRDGRRPPSWPCRPLRSPRGWGSGSWLGLCFTVLLVDVTRTLADETRSCLDLWRGIRIPALLGSSAARSRLSRLRRRFRRGLASWPCCL